MSEFEEHGAYRGVPYTIEATDFAGWDLVNPRNMEAAVFLCYSNQYGKSHHVNYPEKYKNECFEIIRNLCYKNYKNIVKNYKARVGAAGWKEALGPNETPEEFAKKFVDDCLAEAQNYSGHLRDIIQAAELGHHFDEFRGDSQGEHCYSVYLLDSGKKLTKADIKHYNAIRDEIDNWLWGRCFEVSTPLANSGTFTDHESPGIDVDCAASDFIKSEIDELFEQKSGRYQVLASYASPVEDDNGEFCGVSYDESKEVKFFTDNRADAQTIAGFYHGHAVVIDTREKTSREQE